MDALLDAVNFRIKMGGEDVAVAIAQDHGSGEILMAAFMNRAALEKTIETGLMHYYSTSRQRLWKKGEESGHVQRVREVFIDCDGDALVFKVDQKGAACHTGHYTCFYRRLKGDGWQVVGRKVFNPEDVYRG
ncbi:MAG: phosphoribosyl-AMP cyclohydrolase [Methanobacteriota archaeon]|nr:MAG: phosphoribosyl-AMP cyclohydrolase [Euryarchaeota archaeon]